LGRYSVSVVDGVGVVPGTVAPETHTKRLAVLLRHMGPTTTISEQAFFLTQAGGTAAVLVHCAGVDVDVGVPVGVGVGVVVGCVVGALVGVGDVVGWVAGDEAAAHVPVAPTQV
jgi:hypothetical protein